MRRLNLRHLEQEQERALLALERGDWWNGSTWRPRGTLPGTRKEATAFQTAHDRLGELSAAVLGDGGWPAFKRYSQARNALHKHDPRKDRAAAVERILLSRFGARRLRGRLDKGLICDCLQALGQPWTYDGVKTFLRRRKRLQTPGC